MPKLTIDNREIDVPPGTTLLGAAARLGIEIPTLCFLEGREPSTSCLACVVQVGDDRRLVPACATAAAEGMVVRSETPEVHQARRTALELLLSDHVGDCLAPCWFGCPAQMDIPQMLRQIAAGDLRGAIATVKADIALPAVLGRVCPAPCEKTCRRAGLDGTVAICQLKRYVADVDLATANPYLPVCKPTSGRRVAIVGGGPTGLAAAYYLARLGHACTLLDDREMLGGRLQEESARGTLPADVLAAEIAQIARLPIDVCLGACVGTDVPFAELTRDFDAVLLACGAGAVGQAASWGVKAGPHGIEVGHKTYHTGIGNIFASGTAIRGRGMVVRSVADGKEAAGAIDRFLVDCRISAAEPPLNSRIGKMDAEELRQFAVLSSTEPRREVPLDVPATEAARQAARCLHCDCRKLASCKLRKYAAQYGADPRRYKAERRRFVQDTAHAEVVFEPGKCIDCGLCIQIAAEEGGALGLSFVGRGFNVRVGVPLDGSLAEALGRAAGCCVAACPTAALAWKKG